jgi:hypothetical protein
MAAKKTPTAKLETPKASPPTVNKTPTGPEPGTTRTGVDILPADREVLNGTIDERMAALLKDHQEMGVRPK